MLTKIIIIILISYVIIFRHTDTRRLDASSSHVGGVDSAGRGINSNPWTVVAKVSGVQETIARYPANTTIHPMTTGSPLTARQPSNPPIHPPSQSGLREKSALAHIHTMNAIAPPPRPFTSTAWFVALNPAPPSPPTPHHQWARSNTCNTKTVVNGWQRRRRRRQQLHRPTRPVSFLYNVSRSLSFSLVRRVSLRLRFSVRTHNNLFSCIRITFGGRGGEDGSAVTRTHTSRSFSRRPLSVRPAAQHMCTTPTTLYAAHKVPLLLFIIIYYTTHYYSDYNTCSVPV